jgi:Tfp pilus assembly protein PilN
MANINFVPDDYVQSNESRRANLVCLVLLMVVIVGLAGASVIVRMRQRACMAEDALITAKTARMQEAIKQFEQLQEKRREMMRTALTTAELLESVPRSVLLASLTNTLPPGVSLMRLELQQKEAIRPARPAPAPPVNKYQAAQGGAPQPAADTPMSAEKMMETLMDIEGMAPSDIQVASYIERLSNSPLLTAVALVESKEITVDQTTFRNFRLKAMLNHQIHLTKEDVDSIRTRAERSIFGSF